MPKSSLQRPLVIVQPAQSLARGGHQRLLSIFGPTFYGSPHPGKLIDAQIRPLEATGDRTTSLEYSQGRDCGGHQRLLLIFGPTFYGFPNPRKLIDAQIQPLEATAQWESVVRSQIFDHSSKYFYFTIWKITKVLISQPNLNGFAFCKKTGRSKFDCALSHCALVITQPAQSIARERVWRPLEAAPNFWTNFSWFPTPQEAY